MAKKSSKIPRFRSTEEEAKFWDTHDSEEFSEEWEEVDLKVRKPLIHVLDLRLEMDGATLTALEKLAQSQDTHAIALLHRWIDGRLREEDVTHDE